MAKLLKILPAEDTTECLIGFSELIISIVSSNPFHFEVAIIGFAFDIFLLISFKARLTKKSIVFSAMVVYHRISRIFIAVRTETRDFFFCTLFAYIRKLPIFCHIFPIIELFHEFLVAVNAFVLHKFATIFAFSWFFETHHLVKVRIELKRFLATPEIAFENFWVFLQLIVALVAF